MSRKLHLSHGEASKLFPPLAYMEEKKLFFCQDKTLAFGFAMYPVPGADDKTESRFNVLLNQDWPEGAGIQFSLFTSPDIEAEIMGYMGQRMMCPDPAMIGEANTRAEWLRESTMKPINISKSGGMVIRNQIVTIVAKIPLKGDRPSADEISHCEQLQQETDEALKNCGFAPTALTQHIYTRVMQSILNWGRDAGWRDKITPESDPNVLIQDQLLDWGKALDVDKTGIWLNNGEKRVKVLSVKRYPQEAYFGMAKSFLSDALTGARGIRDNVLISGSIIFPDVNATRSTIETKRNWTIQQTRGNLAEFVPSLATKRDGFEVLYEALDDGDRPIKFYLGMALFADSEKASQRAVSNAKTYYRDLGFQLMEDTHFCGPLFLNLLPMGVDFDAVPVLRRYRTMGTRHAIPMLPVWGDWRGTKTPVMPFFSRNMMPMNIDWWDTKSAMNVLICAQTGMGKSVLANHAISSYLSLNGQDGDDGAQVWVIDVGRSYLNQAKIYGGEFLEFGQNSGVCLNPFQLVEDYSEESDILVGLLVAMAAPNDSLTDLQIAELKRHLSILWEKHGKELTIDHIADSLQSDEDQRVVDVGRQLFAFTSKGEYGRYFVGKNNVNFNNRLCVLELEELKQRRHLQQVVLLQLIYQIQQECYLGRRSKRKLLLIDEAWSLLTEGAVASFIETAYRRFRKYGAAAVCITQSVLDVHQSAAGRAIAENSPNMMLLGQKEDAIDAIQRERKLPVSDGEYSIIKTVESNPPYYSEIYCITAEGRGVARLVLPPFYQLMYSTKAEDFEAVQSRIKAGMNTTEAINDVLRERGQLGDTDAA